MDGSRSRPQKGTGPLDEIEFLSRQLGDLGRQHIEAVHRGIAALPAERGGTASAKLGSHGRRREVQALVALVAKQGAEVRQLDADGKLCSPALSSSQLRAGESGMHIVLGAAGGLRPDLQRRCGHLGKAAANAAGVPYGMSQNG